jgi:hypothetical protein
VASAALTQNATETSQTTVASGSATARVSRASIAPTMNAHRSNSSTVTARFTACAA